MTTELLGIILAVASIAIAILIYFLQRNIRYPGALTFAFIEMRRVMNSTPQSYSELSLRYNDYKIEEDLYYIKFIFYNDKSYDYSIGDDETPLRVNLPEGYKWVDARIVDSSEDVQANIINKDDNSIFLRFNLLRKNDRIEVDGLIESKSRITLKDFVDDIIVYHRIPNVSPVKKKSILDELGYKREKYKTTVFGIILVCYLLLLLNALFIHPTNPLRFQEIESGVVHSMYVDRKGEIVYHDGFFIWNYSDSISKEDFVEKYEPFCAPATIQKSDYIYIPLFSTWFILFFIFGGWSFSSVFKTKKIMKMLNMKYT